MRPIVLPERVARSPIGRVWWTVILIEHQTRFVFSTCDEVTVLDAGEVVAVGSASEVRANARVREVYLGR
jgi:ABC-type branched-subunit amino acid transport system ATPase component